MDHFATLDFADLDRVIGGAAVQPNVNVDAKVDANRAVDQATQASSTVFGCTAGAAGNWMQGQPAGGAVNDWGRCVQSGQPIPAYNQGQSAY
jgi:hypothetical protein